MKNIRVFGSQQDINMVYGANSEYVDFSPYSFGIYPNGTFDVYFHD